MLKLCILLALSVQTILTDHEKELLRAIDNEQKHIEVAIYTFTNRRIANRLVDARKRGVAVEVFIDPFSQKNGAIDLLLKQNIPVYVYKPEDKKSWTSLCHHKFCTFESQKGVWTGSYNFTYRAENSHRENAILILDDKSAYEEFSKEFNTLKTTKGEPLKLIEKSSTIKPNGI